MEVLESLFIVKTKKCEPMCIIYNKDNNLLELGIPNLPANELDPWELIFATFEDSNLTWVD